MRNCFCIFAILFFIFPSFAHAAVVINEIDWMGTDIGGANCEWIELANTSSSAQSLSGWTLSITNVGASTPKTLALTGSIVSNGFYLIARNTSPCLTLAPGNIADWSGSFSSGISNNGATLVLSDAMGPIDTVDGSNGWKIGGDPVKGKTTKDAKETAQRTTNNAWITATPTPGKTNADVSDSSNSDSTSPDNSSDTTDTITDTVTTTYTPPPSALTLDAGGNQDATMDVPLHFSTRTTVKSGAVVPSAKILWGFGDGSSAEGSSIEKTYRYAGAYLVVVTATDGIATGRDEFIVTVRPAQVRILGVSDTGIMIANDASERLDLSGWALFAGTGSFRIPSGTVLLPKANILFSSDITKLLTMLDVTLAYPDGVIAGRYAFSPEPVVATTASVSTFAGQPSSATVSYKQVQTVEPIISTNGGVPAVHENTAVSAPAATTELAAAGAALPPAPDSSSASPQTSAAGIFKSPWTLGFIGTMLLAGVAFIFI